MILKFLIKVSCLSRAKYLLMAFPFNAASTSSLQFSLLSTFAWKLVCSQPTTSLFYDLEKSLFHNHLVLARVHQVRGTYLPVQYD